MTKLCDAGVEINKIFGNSDKIIVLRITTNNVFIANNNKLSYKKHKEYG